MFITKYDLMVKIADAVREACAKLGIPNGAIMIDVAAAEAFSEFDWFGGPSGMIFPINPEAGTGFGNVADEEYDVASVAAMKIGGAKLAMRQYNEEGVNPTPEQCTSGALPDSSVITGTCNWPGAVAIEIGRLIGPLYGCHGGCPYRGELFATIYVSVAGGSDELDEKAAWAALSVIRKEVDKVDDLMLARGFNDFLREE